MPLDENFHADDVGMDIEDEVTEAGAKPDPVEESLDDEAQREADAIAAAAAAPAPAETPAAGGEPEPAPAGEKPKVWNDSFQRRVDELTRKRRDAETEATTERQKRERLEHELALYRAGNAPPAGDAPPATPSARTYTEAEVEARAETLAQQRADHAQQAQRAAEFNTRCDDVFTQGVTKFGDDFKTALGNLNNAGIISQEDMSFVQAALRTSDPAAVLNHYGRDPDATARIVGLDPVDRAIEMDRLARELAKPAAPKPLTKAPMPIAPINANAPKGEVDIYSDDVDDAEWFAARDRQRAAKAKTAR